MEAAEGFHIENPPSAVLKGSYQSLSNKHNVADPTLFKSPLFTPKEFHNASLQWFPAREILSHKRILIPYSLICMDSTKHLPERAYFSVSSNGLAAGNTEKEAFLHALFELNERDDLALWSSIHEVDRANRLLNQETITGVARDILDKVNAAGVVAKIWDISTTSLKTFRCVLFDKKNYRKLGMAFGTGSHISSDIALCRAICEAAQDRLILISGNRDDVLPDFYHKICESEALSAQFTHSNGTYPFQSNTIRNPTSIHDCTTWAKSILTREKGVKQIFIVSHTRPDIGIPVVQVLIPKLEYSYRRM